MENVIFVTKTLKAWGGKLWCYQAKIQNKPSEVTRKQGNDINRNKIEIEQTKRSLANANQSVNGKKVKLSKVRTVIILIVTVGNFIKGIVVYVLINDFLNLMTCLN